MLAARDSSAMIQFCRALCLVGAGFGIALLAQAAITEGLLSTRRAPSPQVIVAMLMMTVGGLAGALVLARSSAARDRDRRRLAESYARLDAILAISSEAIISHDEDHRITLFNEGAEKLFGWSRDEVIGGPMERLLPERYRDRHRLLVRQFAGEAVQARRMGERSREIFGLRKDGREFPAEAAISRVEIGGKMIFSVILRDVSERWRHEDEQRFLASASDLLARSLDYEQTLQRIAELSVSFLAECCCVIDLVKERGGVKRFTVVHSSEDRAELCQELQTVELDFGEPNLVRPVLERREPVLIPEITPDLLASLAQHPRHHEILCELAPTSLMGVPLMARGVVLGAMIFVSTDPERRYDTQDLAVAEQLACRAGVALDNARLYRAAQDAIRSRDSVLGVVAHDLRNPLNNVQLAATVLTLPDALHDREETIQRAVRTILRSVKQSSHLIQDLLDAAQMEGAQITVAPRPMPTAQLVREAVELYADAATAAEIRLVADLPSELPDIDADELRVLQVFSNLIGNALKFTAPHGEIRVSAAARGDAVCFEVKDTGEGIAPEHIDHLFDAFWQARPGEQRGAGLGLSIARGIVEAHGGRIWAESEPGQGSSFYFTLAVAPKLSSRGDVATH